MYDRIISPPKRESYFLFGPRGTGKSSWVRSAYPNATYIDLLEDEIYRKLLTHPDSLRDFLPAKPSTVILDEVQKVPAILDEIHRLIEQKKHRFVLTGSSARKLKKQGTNLLAGRALTYSFFPSRRENWEKTLKSLKPSASECCLCPSHLKIRNVT